MQVTPADPARAALALRDVGQGGLIIAIALGLASGSELGPLLRVAADLGAGTASITANSTRLPARHAGVNLVVPTKTASGHPTFGSVATVLSILWQAPMVEDQAGTHQGIQDSTQTLMLLIKQGDKISDYDNAALMRLWQQ